MGYIGLWPHPEQRDPVKWFIRNWKNLLVVLPRNMSPLGLWAYALILYNVTWTG